MIKDNRVSFEFPFENKCQTCIDFHFDFLKQVEFFNNKIYQEQLKTFELQKKYNELYDLYQNLVHEYGIKELKELGQDVAV